MRDLPRPVWVRVRDGAALPGWCRAVRRERSARWIGFVCYTDRGSGLQYLHWVDEAELSPRSLAEPASGALGTPAT